jgi:hypothetical protein
LSGLSYVTTAGCAGNAKIDQLDRAIEPQHHVLRADVAVDDAQGLAASVGQRMDMV